MSDQEITLKLEKRTIEGKAVRGLRRDGIVPAVIHDHGKDSIIVMGPFVTITKAFQSAGKRHPLTVDVDGKKYITLIKDVDFEPRKHIIRHVVFNAIKADEKQQTEVPVHLTGDAPAEKTGLLVIRNLDSVEIEALPKDLIDELTVDISQLIEIGDKVTVADLKAPSGVEILTEGEHPIAVVEEPKEIVEEEPEEPAEGEEGEAGEAGDANAEGGDSKSDESEAVSDEKKSDS